MPTRYKIWLQIEKQTGKFFEEEYENVSEPEELACFEGRGSFAKAKAAALKIEQAAGDIVNQ